MEEPVTIVDRDVLKVLAVDTRMDILKELSQGDRTPSYLSGRLKKSDATIVEHLEVLSKAGLVKKIEQPGKKWIFYTLTDQGYGIIASKSRKLVIILATSLISMAGGVVGFLNYSYQGSYYTSQPLATEIGKTAADAVVTIPWPLYLSYGLVIVGLAGIGFYFYQKLKGWKYE